MLNRISLVCVSELYGECAVAPRNKFACSSLDNTSIIQRTAFCLRCLRGRWCPTHRILASQLILNTGFCVQRSQASQRSLRHLRLLRHLAASETKSGSLDNTLVVNYGLNWPKLWGKQKTELRPLVLMVHPTVGPITWFSHLLHMLWSSGTTLSV